MQKEADDPVRTAQTIPADVHSVRNEWCRRTLTENSSKLKSSPNACGLS
jgi:hypothetical protein